MNPTPVPENLLFLLKTRKEVLTPRELETPEAPFAGALTVVLDMGAFDRLGAHYNAFTSEENTVYYAAVLPEYLCEVADLCTRTSATGELLEFVGIQEQRACH